MYDWTFGLLLEVWPPALFLEEWPPAHILEEWPPAHFPGLSSLLKVPRIGGVLIMIIRFFENVNL